MGSEMCIRDRVGLRVLGAGEEVLLVSEKGVIVRTSADAIPQQSRAATGVRLQKLDKGDRLLKVVLVPPEAEEDSADDTSNDSESSDTEAANTENNAQDS